MKILNVIGFIESSSARIFRAECSDGNQWVIRCKKKDKNSRRLFSEYVGGVLAQSLGIYHPPVKLVDVPSSILQIINKSENIFDEECTKAVATLYIEGLEEINLSLEDIFHFRNSNHIYGYILFIFWVHLSDYYKQENVQRAPNNEIVFLDFDLAFSSNIEEWGNLPEYDDLRIAINQPEFLERFTNKLAPFEEWLKRLLKFSKNATLNNIGTLPDCWQLPLNYLNRIIDFLFDNRSRFIQEFKSSIELKRNLLL